MCFTFKRIKQKFEKNNDEANDPNTNIINNVDTDNNMDGNDEDTETKENDNNDNIIDIMALEQEQAQYLSHVMQKYYELPPRIQRQKIANASTEI